MKILLVKIKTQTEAVGAVLNGGLDTKDGRVVNTWTI